MLEPNTEANIVKPAAVEKPTIDVPSKITEYSSQFLLLTAAFFFAEVYGLMTMLSSEPVSMLSLGSYTLILMWIACPSLVFVLIAWRLYKPLAQVREWLDKYAGDIHAS